jgi:RNA polymerase sigma-70 factor (ECF subfamily)
MVLDREIQIAIREALDKLPAEARAVLTLRYLEEFSTPEISEILKVPAGTVRSRLYYARLELARIMEPFVDSAIPARSKERE